MQQTVPADHIPAWVDGQLMPVEKLEVHRRALRHKAVSVFVLRGGRVLIQRRALGKYHTPGLWANTCCTHPMWAEADADCAARRLREELGLEGLHLRPAGEVEYRAEVGQGLIEHEVVAMFRAEAAEGIEPRLNRAEVMDVRWMSLDELRAEIAATPDAFTPWLRIYLADHAELIFGSEADRH